MFLGGSISDILPPLAVLFGLLIVGGVIILRIRKNLYSNQKKTATYSLSDLKKMLEAGDITDDEYTKARDVVVSQTRVSTPDIKENGQTET
ncbi:MAG: hypothetical protein QF718_10145 [Phycisphaerales bacterium]|jgi:uncharacterized membrane protein|nr:hypothetical protein [Phycisphaerales bacterium]